VPAIENCLVVWRQVYKAKIAKNKSRYESADGAGNAYRNAMPPLIGFDNIRDFIACATHGLLIGAINGEDATKLLYAAQVALSTLRLAPVQPKPTSV
jgi:hypothetical protein